ncbi:MAG: glycosyltransferase family 2 protein [Candidatus Competibacter sp.]|nr:glycosyltransferase family 2 protein [Candidatus Competibacter sp.]
MVSKPSSVWVVIAAYNEDPVIADVVRDVVASGFSVVVVDDGSQDDTANKAGLAGALIVQHPINLGQGAALQTGIDYALGAAANILVTYDADGQHRVEDVFRLVEALMLNDVDYVLGSRFIGKSQGMPLSRRLLLKTATWFTRLTTGLAITDTHNGLRAMSQRGASCIRLRQNRMAHATEILHQIASSRLNYIEIPVMVDYTVYSLAKGQRFGDAISILLDLLSRQLNR